MKKISNCKWHNQKGMLTLRRAQLPHDHLAFAVSKIIDHLGKIQSKLDESQVKWLRYSMHPKECMI